MSERQPYKCARNARCLNAVPVERTEECPCQCHGQSEMNRQCDVEGGCGHLHTREVQGSPILTSEGLCTACTHRVSEALLEAPMDYTELHFLLASGESGITTDVVMGSKELQVPIRVSVEALQAAMVSESQAWAEPVAERLGISWDTEQMHHCRPGFVLQRATSLLRSRLDVFLALPEQTYRPALDSDWIERDGIDGALELLRLHGMVRFAAGRTKLVHELPAPCPRCQQFSLVRHNGSDIVQCESCPGVRWVEADYKRLCLVLAEDYRDDAA